MGGTEARTRTGRLVLDEELGIIRFGYYPGALVTLIDAKEILEATSRLSQGKRYPLLVDMAGCKAVARDARDYLGRAETDEIWRALGIVGSSPIGAMIGNIFLSLRRGTSPCKLFSSEDDAIAWLRGFID